MNMSLDTVIEALAKDEKLLREKFILTKKVFGDERKAFTRKWHVLYNIYKS